MAFDMTSAFRSDLPAPDSTWEAPPAYSFVGGHNDAASVPFTGLAEAALSVLRREGRALANYNLGGSPLGYRPLREFLAASLATRASMHCDPEQILITSGSLQALDLVNEAMLEPGDTVLVEQATYGGMISRLDRIGVNHIGIELDAGGLRVDHLRSVLDGLRANGVKPKYLYTIPTVQNPTGSVLSVERRQELLSVARANELPIFEDECYADLIWGCERPPTIRALDDGNGQVIYCGSFSKSIAPALRVGYIVAEPSVIQQLLALKTDAGTGALEQLTLAEFGPTHFEAHVARLTATLHQKCKVMVASLREQFGDSVEIVEPRGGIFVWVTFPEGVDTAALAPAAARQGIEFNRGAGWSSDPEYGRRRLRLCFGHPDHDTIRSGVAALADVVRKQGVDQ